jgi:hypothetical protein
MAFSSTYFFALLNPIKEHSHIQSDELYLLCDLLDDVVSTLEYGRESGNGMMVW